MTLCPSPVNGGRVVMTFSLKRIQQVKNRKWSLLFLVAFLIGCGDSTTTESTNDSPIDTEVAAVTTTDTSNDLSVDIETTTDTNTTNDSYRIVLKSTKKIAGYEIHLKFTDTIPATNTLTLNSDFLASTGRTVNDLGPDINTTGKEIKFGAFSFGNDDGVSGKFKLFSFKLTQGEVSIVKEICIDKNAQKIDCDIKIERN